MASGLDPAHYWGLTYRETQAIIDGAAARLRREQDDRAWLAWHVEALHRTKKLPKLKDMLRGKSSRRKTPEEMIAIAHRWTAALGGLR